MTEATTTPPTSEPVAGPVQRPVRPLSDETLLRWLHAHMDWDGNGYWLPDVCIREPSHGQESCDRPTIDEFRAVLSEHIRAA